MMTDLSDFREFLRQDLDCAAFERLAEGQEVAELELILVMDTVQDIDENCLATYVAAFDGNRDAHRLQCVIDEIGFTYHPETAQEMIERLISMQRSFAT